MTRPSFLPRFSSIIIVSAFISIFPHLSAQAAERNVPKEFATIQAAIAAATDGDIIMVEPGLYAGPITLRNNISLRGRETARTLLTGDGGGPIIVSNGDISAGIRNFTFIDATIGIQVTNSNSVLSITNNVFTLGTGGAAIQAVSASSTQIVNNTFFRNGAAVTGDPTIQITNNIFSGNSVAINTGGAATISNNAFSGNGATVGTNPVSGDPLFVAPANRDFHLKEFSPCIDQGNPAVGSDFDGTQSDIGAYGGPSADPTPFPVQGLALTGVTETSISFSWQANDNYLVSNVSPTSVPGSYKVYYGYAPGVYDGTDATGGFEPSPIDAGLDTFFELVELAPIEADPLTAPALEQPSPRDGALVLTWSVVPGAAGYKVHYGALSKGENTIDVGNRTSYRLPGLANGQAYRIAVSAYASARTYYIAVTAVDNTLAAHESAFSQELAVPLGSTRESGLSDERVEYPEPITIFPDLPDGRRGCFIATAAFGYYSAPEVHALRVFRDRYLLTNKIGRTFVNWYYRRGPAGAAFLNAHPGLKPVVRAALMPAVGAALFLTRAPLAVKTGVLLITCLTAIAVMARRRAGRDGDC